jgi:hypothetical protein
VGKGKNVVLECCCIAMSLIVVHCPSCVCSTRGARLFIQTKTGVQSVLLLPQPFLP